MIFYVFNFLKSNFWKVWKINLSQFWIPYGLNNHKVSPGSMTKRVVSHFDYNTITFNVKCDQIIVSWTYLTHLGGNQTPLNIITVKEVIWNHNFDQYYDLLWVKHVESCVSTWGNRIWGWPVRFNYVYRIILWLNC